MLRKLLSVVGVSSLLVIPPLTAASAADMPVKAPPPAAAVAAPAADWTGIFIDGAVGWQQSRFYWALTNPVPATIPPFTLTSNDGELGGHFGYQHQFNWLVVGGEFGASSTLRKFASATANGTALGPACYGPAGNVCAARAGAVITYGGKLGVAWQNWLVYGVGGGATGSVSSVLYAPSGALFDTTNGPKYTGYYAGGGFDYVFGHTRLIDMIGGIEYEHIDLGTQYLASSADGFIPSPPGVNGRNVSAKEDIVWGKVTVKLNPWK